MTPTGAAAIEQMEQQEPVYLFRRKGWGVEFCTCSKERYEEFSTNPRIFEVKKLYLATGAQPAPSIPEGWKKDLFRIQHAMAMNNWNWESDASNDTKRAAYTAVARLLAAAEARTIDPDKARALP